MSPSKSQPIVVIKKKVGHGGHHGGAWKVAYADFVTALMALFIVLWLMNSSEPIKKAVAGYFNDPRGNAALQGTTMTGSGETIVSTNTTALTKLKDKLEKEIAAQKDLQKLKKQIQITITSEGLRIEMLENKGGTFYQSGSAQLSPSGQELLALLAAELKHLPNKLLIEGYTDAAPYAHGTDYTNWELSADRANAARRLMRQHGVGPDQVSQVRAYADQMLRDPANPFDPSNRRVTILVKNRTAPIPGLSAGEVAGQNGAAPAPHTPAAHQPAPAHSGR
ncbi:MAG TPA: flagellar motor protein MotB [Terracidiphilus sp.]|nr:flagellar motor protein MotB [Terracidiphilus sp.]